MGYFTGAELQKYLNNEDMSARLTARYTMPNMQPAVLEELVTLEWCDEWVNNLHSRVINGQWDAWKAYRPWNVVDLTSSLDPNKRWIGWEIETGWDSASDRRGVIRATLEKYDHCCTDDEGIGYGVELTFSPDDGSRYDYSPLLHVCDMADEWNNEGHDTYDQVGTHINVSTPSFRHLTSRQAQSAVCSVMNRALTDVYEEWESLFGREDVYGGFFLQASWLEGKLFNTTYSREEAKKYLKVGENIASMIEQISVYMTENADSLDARGDPLVYITNPLAAFRDGEECEFEKTSRYHLCGDDLEVFSDDYDNNDWFFEEDED